MERRAPFSLSLSISPRVGRRRKGGGVANMSPLPSSSSSSLPSSYVLYPHICCCCRCHSHSLSLYQSRARKGEGEGEGMNWLSHPFFTSSDYYAIIAHCEGVQMKDGEGGGGEGDKGRKLPLFTRCDLSLYAHSLSLTSPNSLSSKAIPTPITY